MCKLRRCLANTHPRQLAAGAVVVLLCGAVFVDLWRADEHRREEASRAGTLALELRVEPGKPQPQIWVELFSDDPATEHREVSVVRRLYSDIREQFAKPNPQFISVQHDIGKVQALRPVASEWIGPGDRRELRLKPGRYVLSCSIRWGRELNYAHSMFYYRNIEIKPGERIEIDDLLNGWTR